MQLSIRNVERADPPKARSAHQSARLVIRSTHVADNSPFLIMAEDWFAPPAGFPMHPHRGMETVTFILEGQMLHEDHMGNNGSLDAGGVEFMTAGSGVMHSEMPGPKGVHSLQLWLNLPARLKKTKPRYADVDRSLAPVHREEGVVARVYSGKIGDASIAYGTTWPLTLVELCLDAEARFDMPVPAGDRLFAYVLAGTAQLGSDSTSVAAGDIAWGQLSPSTDETDILRVTATSSARILIYASPPINEPVAMGGPFVMNTQAEIEQAFADLRAGRLVR
jgi:quercetin 2,3-dioxygenase